MEYLSEKGPIPIITLENAGEETTFSFLNCEYCKQPVFFSKNQQYDLPNQVYCFKCAPTLYRKIKTPPSYSSSVPEDSDPDVLAPGEQDDK